MKKGLKKSDVNPYVQQAQNQVGQFTQQAEQAVEQAQQFVQNNIPNGENNQ